MHRITLATLTTLTTLLVATGAFAQDAPPMAPAIPGNDAANSINLSPLGIAFGSYALNFEHRLNPHHGLIAEAAFGSSTDANASSTNFGAQLGWRMHFAGKQQGWFIGAMAGYLTGTGSGTVTSTVNGQTTSSTFDVNTSTIKFTGNVGKRWLFGPGINVTVRFGLGYGKTSVSTDSTDPLAKDAVELVDALVNLLPITLDGELSVGYCF